MNFKKLNPLLLASIPNELLSRPEVTAEAKLVYSTLLGAEQCTIQGSFKEEKAIHSKFSALRIRGEWFKPEKELLRFILEESL